MQLRHAEEQRAHWRSLIAQEVLDDPQLVALVRLCGVRDLIAFALTAFIGDIKRFANPKKLVSTSGLIRPSMIAETSTGRAACVATGATIFVRC